MKRIFASPERAQVDLSRSVLESANIPCEIRNEAVSQLPGMAFISELWVLHDSDYAEAARLLARTEPDENVA